MDTNRKSKYVLAWVVVIASIVAGALLWTGVSGVGIVYGLLIALGAMVVNGFVATLEDDLPGGFNNPDGKSTTRYVAGVGIFSHILLVLVLILIAAILLFSAHDIGWLTTKGLAMTSFAVGTACVYIALKIHRALGLVGIAIFIAIPAVLLWWKHAA